MDWVIEVDIFFSKRKLFLVNIPSVQLLLLSAPIYVTELALYLCVCIAPETVEDVEPKTVEVEALQAAEVPAPELAPVEKAPETQTTAAVLGWQNPPANVSEDASMQWFLFLVLALILLLRLLAWLFSVGCCLWSYFGSLGFEANS
jgi:hypothetical protein